MSTPPPPPGYGTLPPDPNEPPRGPYPTGQSATGPYPGPPATPAAFGQAPYGQALYGQAPSPQANTLKTLGIVSVVAGVIGIPAACCCWFIGWIPALVAVGAGAAGLAQLKNDPTTDAKPFLIIGLVLGIIGLLMTLGAAIWGFASFANDF